MASTFTPNIQLEEPARGDDVGTWDTPVNSNMTLVDKVVGSIATIGLNNSPVVLSAAQFQSKTIVFNSTLTGSVTITFPTSFTKSYEIFNLCTGSSAFTITLATTAGGRVICPPPGEGITAINDAASIGFINLGRVGSYWDYAGSSVPAWVSGCTVAPYLNCDGSPFSAATFPALAVILGSTTLPDGRGNTRATLNQGTARITTAGSGLDGNTRFSVGGSQLLTAHQHTGATGGETAGHVHAYVNPAATTAPITLGGVPIPISNGTLINTAGESVGHTHNFTTDISGGGGSQNIPPTYIGGLTLIRSA